VKLATKCGGFDPPEAVSLGVPAFACTPELFGDLTAAAIRREDLSRFAAR